MSRYSKYDIIKSIQLGYYDQYFLAEIGFRHRFLLIGYDDRLCLIKIGSRINIKKIYFLNNENVKSLYTLDNYQILMGTDKGNLHLISVVKSQLNFDGVLPICNNVNIETLKSSYPDIINILSILPDINKFALFEKLSLDDFKDTPYADSEIFRLEWETANGFSYKLVLAINPDKKYYECYMNINDTEDLFCFYNYETHYKMNIEITEKDGNICIYNATNSRSINYSNNVTLFTFKPNYWINVDKSNTIVNTNLPFNIGKRFDKYNMFGVPSKI
jgi:hypothetical protein